MSQYGKSRSYSTGQSGFGWRSCFDHLGFFHLRFFCPLLQTILLLWIKAPLVSFFVVRDEEFVQNLDQLQFCTCTKLCARAHSCSTSSRMFLARKGHYVQSCQVVLWRHKCCKTMVKTCMQHSYHTLVFSPRVPSTPGFSFNKSY